jgi:hypothetical protein
VTVSTDYFLQNGSFCPAGLEGVSHACAGFEAGRGHVREAMGQDWASFRNPAPTRDRKLSSGPVNLETEQATAEPRRGGSPGCCPDSRGSRKTVPGKGALLSYQNVVIFYATIKKLNTFCSSFAVSFLRSGMDGDYGYFSVLLR